MTIYEEKKQNPPYLSYKTFEHFLSRLHEPLFTCFDSDFWGKMYYGDTGMQLDSAMRFLYLIDNNDGPTSRFENINRCHWGAPCRIIQTDSL